MSHRRKEKDAKKTATFQRKVKQGQYIRQEKGIVDPPTPKAGLLDCVFDNLRSCVLDFDCENCEHLPREEYHKYRGDLAKKKGVREKMLGQVPSTRVPIRCNPCGKIIGYVYENQGPVLREGGFRGEEELAYCEEHLPGGN